jgi:putative ABC transport system permease protein
MSYLSLILKNPFRNKTRSALAIVGIAVGIATIVALGLVTGGLKAATSETLNAGGSDLTVSEANSNFMSGTIEEARVEELNSISGVKNAAGVLRKTPTINTTVEGSFGSFSVNGIELDKLSVVDITSGSVEGTLFSSGSNEIILGKTAAESLEKKVGDSINLFGEDFTITGIFETGNIMYDGAAFTSLDTLQDLTNSPGEVSTIYVQANDNTNLTELSKNIEDTYPNELTATSASALTDRINEGLSIIDSATWAISLLAIFIGGVGVINTMIMSVYERTREIGVLKAVGWRSRRILGMIMGESIVLTLLAAVVGTVLGVLGAVAGLSLLGGEISPAYSLDVFVRGFLVAILVGVLGGIYPAYRASRLPPTEALRYE